MWYKTITRAPQTALTDSYNYKTVSHRFRGLVLRFLTVSPQFHPSSKDTLYEHRRNGARHMQAGEQLSQVTSIFRGIIIVSRQQICMQPCG